MQATTASRVLLALALTDVAALDLVLAPRLALALRTPTHAQAARRPAQTRAPPPTPAVVTVSFTVAPSAPEAVQPVRAVAVDAPPPSNAPAPTSALDDIRFGLDETALRNYFVRRRLTRVAAELRAQPSRRLWVRGHTDQFGTAASNLALSRQRAEEAVRFLVTRGAPQERIEIEAVGDREPLDRSNTPLAWARNRRVEILWK